MGCPRTLWHAVQDLVQGLASNNTLTSLDLRQNNIGLVGCRLLSTCLKEKNHTLQNLDMAGNDMEDMVLQV